VSLLSAGEAVLLSLLKFSSKKELHSATSVSGTTQSTVNEFFRVVAKLTAKIEHRQMTKQFQICPPI